MQLDSGLAPDTQDKLKALKNNPHFTLQFKKMLYETKNMTAGPKASQSLVRAEVGEKEALWEKREEIVNHVAIEADVGHHSWVHRGGDRERECTGLFHGETEQNPRSHRGRHRVECCKQPARCC